MRSPQLLMGPEKGFKSDIEKRRSRARRTLLWAALRYITENGYHKKSKKERQGSLERSNVLLIDYISVGIRYIYLKISSYKIICLKQKSLQNIIGYTINFQRWMIERDFFRICYR